MGVHLAPTSSLSIVLLHLSTHTEQSGLFHVTTARSLQATMQKPDQDQQETSPWSNDNNNSKVPGTILSTIFMY